MMSPELLEAENRTAVLSKRTDEEQSISNDEESGILGIQIADSRDDLFDKQEDQCPSSDECVEENEVVQSQLQHEAAADDIKGSADAHNNMVTELRHALLMSRGINRQLQKENDMIKEENISLAETAHRLAEDWTDLREENEQMFEELEMLRAGKAESTPLNDISSSTLSGASLSSTFLQGDHLFEFDESSHANDLNSPPFAIDADFQYVPIAQQGSVDSNDILDNEETAKFIYKLKESNSERRMSDMTESMKSRDTLYDIDELKVTTTKDDDDEDDVTIRMKLELKRDQCNELQKDLEKTAQAFWEQSEDLNKCQSLVVKLQTENDELRCFKWVEAEIDNMWARVKGMDKVKDMYISLLAEKDELKACVIDKSNKIAELKAELENTVQPEMVQSRIDEIEKDLKVLVLELKTAIVEKSNEIAELKKQLQNVPCSDWVQRSIDDIREDLEVILTERNQLKADVVSKAHEIAELKDKLRNADLTEMKKDEHRRHSLWK